MDMAVTPHHMAREIIAANIRALMGRHKCSQEKLAKDALGKKQPAISKRLSGEVAFDIDELLAIAGYFNVEVTVLLRGLPGQDPSSLPWIPTPTDSDDEDAPVTPCEGQLALLAA